MYATSEATLVTMSNVRPCHNDILILYMSLCIKWSRFIHIMLNAPWHNAIFLVTITSYQSIQLCHVWPWKCITRRQWFSTQYVIRGKLCVGLGVKCYIFWCTYYLQTLFCNLPQCAVNTLFYIVGWFFVRFELYVYLVRLSNTLQGLSVPCLSLLVLNINITLRVIF